MRVVRAIASVFAITVYALLWVLPIGCTAGPSLRIDGDGVELRNNPATYIGWNERTQAWDVLSPRGGSVLVANARGLSKQSSAEGTTIAVAITDAGFLAAADIPASNRTLNTLSGDYDPETGAWSLEIDGLDTDAAALERERVAGLVSYNETIGHITSEQADAIVQAWERGTDLASAFLQIAGKAFVPLPAP